jgi:hypothetical protein
VQSAGSVDHALAAHRDVLDGAGEASFSSSCCSTPDQLLHSPKWTVPPHGDPPPIPTPSPSTDTVTLRTNLPAAGECCIIPTCEGCSVSKGSWLGKLIPLALQVNAHCDLKQNGIL